MTTAARTIRNARLMAAAFHKNGTVARATNGELADAIAALDDANEPTDAAALRAEQKRRAAALRRLLDECHTIAAELEG